MERPHSLNGSLLDDLSAIKRIDRSDMLGKAAALPRQCLDGWRLGLAWKLPKGYASPRHLLVLGMGGSAIGGDLLQGIVGDRLSRPITVNRTYTIPAWVNRDTLVLACSYSGNTEETLAAARQAEAQGAKIAAITSGGKLATWASRNNFPLLTIPTGWPPRSAVGYLTFAPLGMLVGLGWVKRKGLGVEEACSTVEEMVKACLSPSIPTHSNPGKSFALKLVGRLLILYGASGGWEGIAYRWRTQLEENAKTLAFHHLFPEATHNEISGWREPRPLMKKATAIFFLDPSIPPRIRRRMNFTGTMIARQGAEVLGLLEFNRGVPPLTRKLCLVALGDFVSIYLGILYRVDPTPVKRVEALKRFMAKNS